MPKKPTHRDLPHSRNPGVKHALKAVQPTLDRIRGSDDTDTGSSASPTGTPNLAGPTPTGPTPVRAAGPEILGDASVAPGAEATSNRQDRGNGADPAKELQLKINEYGNLYILGNPAYFLSRPTVKMLLRMVDAGKVNDLRHFVETGQLPSVPPKWPGKGAVVEKTRYGWTVYAKIADTPESDVTHWRPVAHACQHSDGSWCGTTEGPGASGLSLEATDAQDALNKAYEYICRRWCV